MNYPSMTTEYELSTVLTATVDANGVATTSPAGPQQYGEEWEVQRYSVSLTHPTQDAFGTCKVYRKHVSPTTQIDTTDDGEAATSENNSIHLQSGDVILAQWTDATVGATATINISGKRTVKGQRAY